jgi:hypothetical protein
VAYRTGTPERPRDLTLAVSLYVSIDETGGHLSINGIFRLIVLSEVRSEDMHLSFWGISSGKPLMTFFQGFFGIIYGRKKLYTERACVSIVSGKARRLIYESLTYAEFLGHGNGGIEGNAWFAK